MRKPEAKMAENKTKATAESVDDFLDRLADPARRDDARVIAEIMTRMSGQMPRMWGPTIIGFGTCHYRYESGREGDMPEIAFSPRAKEQVLYVLGFPGQEELLARLGKHRTGTSCLYVKRLADVDLGVLEAIFAASLRETRSRPVQPGC